MCIALYVAVIGLLYFYSDYVIGQYQLAVPGDGRDLMVVAVGWEMVTALWPVLLLAMTIAGVVSVVITRRCVRCAVKS